MVESSPVDLTGNEQHLTPGAWLGTEGRCVSGTTQTQVTAPVDIRVQGVTTYTNYV